MQFRLKDWGISRQRYWGCPIPMYTSKMEVLSPLIKDLPVELPDDIDLNFKETHLKRIKNGNIHYKNQWKKAIRETDTLDTFVTFMVFFWILFPKI